jgi:hypothetical protein
VWGSNVGCVHVAVMRTDYLYVALSGGSGWIQMSFGREFIGLLYCM